ncbi:MAG: OmpA family protein [Acidobacteria bacterium]|nr:OmpA family protein [Acidobacteriota bacterium]MBN9421576.1 OmpA family protein [Accumulibacter sp.]OJW50059.1 MAG: cell envelope biogenesis protein OmpA [Candidatus Accumulibacter sp. 66-26]
MTAHFLRRVATLSLVASCTALASSCSLFRTSVPAETKLGMHAATPAQLAPHFAQLDFGRRARFAECVPPACPTRTPKTLAPETPSQPIHRADSVTSAESVTPTPLAQDPATEAESLRTVTVQFGLGSAKLSPAARSQLNGAMGNHLHVRRIKIIGRTDSTGPLAFNESLALARTLAVRDHFRKTHPTLAATLTLQARGACCFIASNDTVAGRTQNRRAEVVFRMTEEDLP